MLNIKVIHTVDEELLGFLLEGKSSNLKRMRKWPILLLTPTTPHLSARVPNLCLPCFSWYLAIYIRDPPPVNLVPLLLTSLHPAAC